MAKAKKGLRAALRQRQVRKTVYRMPIVEYSVAAEKQQAVTLAESTVKAADYLAAREGETEQIRDARAKAEVALQAARTEFAECFHEIVLQGLPEDEFDALVQLHPPKKEQVEEAREKGEELPLWNESTLLPALLERCAQDSELSAEEWVEELAGWEKGEKKEIRARVLEANIRSYATALSFE